MRECGWLLRVRKRSSLECGACFSGFATFAMHTVLRASGGVCRTRDSNAINENAINEKEVRMKKYGLALLAALLLSGTASAATWQSLGRMNALTALPDVQTCQQRVINHYWSSKPIYTPTNVNIYSADNIEFVFHTDLSSLSRLISNAPANSRFKTAVDAYNARTGARSLHAAVSVGLFPRVGINLSYADVNGLVQGLGWSVVASELQYYELQQLCPQ